MSTQPKDQTRFTLQAFLTPDGRLGVATNGEAVLGIVAMRIAEKKILEQMEAGVGQPQIRVQSKMPGLQVNRMP